jgi:DNA primase
MRDREIIQRIKDSIDLAVLVGSAVKLRKQGSSWVGLCPFHSERTPSFQVVADRGFYHCFGCGKHGDAFTWIMEREGIAFHEALEQLACSVGIEIPWQLDRPAAELDLEARLRIVMDFACTMYKQKLMASADALAYLKNRNIDENFINEAGFGYAPDSWDMLLKHLRTHNFSSELAEQAGLVSRSERGNYIDFLRGRLVIPIFDSRGRVIAFGGRALGNSVPKYLNTRETALFNKSSILFGLHKAKGVLRDGALLVEGYFDVLQLHQRGIYQAVAPLGTAVTEAHLQQIGRFTKKITLCFDGDSAGLRAMEKVLKMALPLGFDIRLLLLPNGEDPDSWCITLGTDAFGELIKKAPDWTNFIINRAFEGKDMRRTSERMEALKELAEFLAFLPRTPEQREVFSSLAHELRIPISELDRVVNARTSALDPVGTVSPPLMVEIDDLLRPIIVLCRDKDVIKKVAILPSAWWESLKGAYILQAILDTCGDESMIEPAILMQLRYLEARWSVKDEAEQILDHVFIKLELSFVEREKQDINRQLQYPAVMVNARLQEHLFKEQEKLLQRSRQLRSRLVMLRRKMFSRQ